MIIHLLAAAAVTFTPFYVGPVQTGDTDVVHYFEYSDDPAVGRALCEQDLRWAFERADCLVSPDTGSWGDATQPGWALPYGPSWASKNPADYTDTHSTNFWGVQDASDPNWKNPWG